MQTSRMFNAGAMRDADLMREVSAMRLAAEAAGSSTAHRGPVSPIGSLAYRIANWRRLSALRLFAGRGEPIVTSPRPTGA